LFRLPFRARDIERDVDDEIAFHLAMRAERLRARGIGDDDAHRVAHRRFGDVAGVRRECVEIDRDLVRRRRAADYLGELMKDLSFALRGLRRAPGFAAAALLSLALGIGAATAIFSVAYGVLFRPLPYPDPERLVEIDVNLTGTGAAYGALSAQEYLEVARVTRLLTSVGAWTTRDRTISGDGRPERINTSAITASAFQTLGLRAAHGRVFSTEEDVAGGPPVIVLTDALWRRRYGADPGIIGRRIELDGVPREVIGVLPRGVGIGDAEAFTPLALDPNHLPGPGAHFLRAIGRMRQSVTVAQASAEMLVFSRRRSEEQAANYGRKGFTASARSLRDAWFGNSRPLMKALLVTVALLLLLAAVNVANLLLVRAEARQRELGVRVALGASRGRIVRQLLGESLLLATIGAVIGIPLAAIAVRSLLAINPGVVPPGAEVSIDLGVVAAVVGAVAIAALIAGVAPALRAGSTDVRTAIATGAAGGARAGGRLRSVLVALEVALAATMLVGAGLVTRSFQRLLSVDAGFQAQGALVLDVALPRVRYDTSTKVIGFQNALLERMRALPGVSSAATLTTLPLASGTIGWSVVAEDRPNSATELSTPFIVSASNDIFRALGIRIVRGRGFTTEDGDGSPFVTVVNEALVREFWPGQDPIGKRIRLSGPDLPWMTVVGVAHDVRPEALSEPPKPMYYVLTPQFARMVGFADQIMTVVLRTPGDPTALIAGARSVVADIDPQLALNNVQTLDAVVENSVAKPRFAASILGAFGLAAMVLAIVGVYGVLSYAMARRRRELAVRMALGAQPGAVRGLVMRSGLKLAGAGVVVGLVTALLASRGLAALLYEVSPTDPLTLTGVGVLLLIAAGAASWIPARRATRVGPAEVLRGE
jgi:predicted permease